MHENFGEARTAVLAGPGKRDLRLDLLRGIGQWMVFLDHIPYNFLNWFTLRNYGFSDAAEIFVFISGYSIGFSYGPAVKAGQFVAGAKRLWTRASQLYVAHIFLFLFFTAQIARTAARFDNPMYKDEFKCRAVSRPYRYNDRAGPTVSLAPQAPAQCRGAGHRG